MGAAPPPSGAGGGAPLPGRKKIPPLFYWGGETEHRPTHRGSAGNKGEHRGGGGGGSKAGGARGKKPPLPPTKGAGGAPPRWPRPTHSPPSNNSPARARATPPHPTTNRDEPGAGAAAHPGLSGGRPRITKRKRAEQALRAAEEQFRGLVEQSIAGIYIIQDGKFAYVNPRFAEIFGYGSADELIGRDTCRWSPRRTAARWRRTCASGSKAKVPSVSYSFTALRKDGSTIEVGVHSTRATHRGQPAVIGLMQDISEKKRAEEQIQRYLEQLETAFMSTVEVATTLSEMRDPYTAGHERRVAEIAVAIGAELGFDARRQEGLRVAGYLHDIGKITIPAEILSKPGKLSAIEFQLIQGHAQASYDVLKDVEFPWPVAEVALQHHERMDGSGYPQGLKGEAILLEARIMAVADVVEAMSSHRPYRPGLGIDAALAEIERGRGSAYDPVVADACLKLFREKGYAIPGGWGRPKKKPNHPKTGICLANRCRARSLKQHTWPRLRPGDKRIHDRRKHG